MRNIVEYEIWILGDDEFIDTEVLAASKTNKTEALQYAEYFSNKENYIRCVNSRDERIPEEAFSNGKIRICVETVKYDHHNDCFTNVETIYESIMK